MLTLKINLLNLLKVISTEGITNDIESDIQILKWLFENNRIKTSPEAFKLLSSKDEFKPLRSKGDHDPTGYIGVSASAFKKDESGIGINRMTKCLKIAQAYYGIPNEVLPEDWYKYTFAEISHGIWIVPFDFDT